MIDRRKGRGYYRKNPMKTFSMTCSCGDVMSVEASNREEAISKMKTTMNEGAVAKHMAERHPGETVLLVAQVHAMISQNLQEAEELIAPKT